METRGSLLFEWEHLRRKLALRSPATLALWREVDLHPLFRIVPGTQSWEWGRNG